MKLKTLKDLRIKGTGNKLPNLYKYFFEEEELKAEAVKWVKNEKSQKGYIEDDVYCYGLVDSFIKFFNLTEEDLK